MDVKQNPLYEKGGFVYLDTHYYGGIKKYQWVTLPLAIHGVVAKTNGDVMTVNIGEDKNDRVFCVTDLLIHLSQEQLKKRADSVIEGEQLDILFASRPLEGKEKEAVKEAVLALLEKKYNMKEEDFLSAELEIVPAGKARNCGIDESMIMAYGQDDRVCAYTSLVAMLGKVSITAPSPPEAQSSSKYVPAISTSCTGSPFPSGACGIRRCGAPQKSISGRTVARHLFMSS